jgi:endonuclease YncB( thermonuclease family)
MWSIHIKQEAIINAGRERSVTHISDVAGSLHGTIARTLQRPDPIVETQLVETQPPVVDQPSIGPQLYKVIKTVDGDTIDVLTDDKKTNRLRFNGINTPERGQPFGNNATKFVSDTVGGKMVRLVTHGEDKYDRTIADIYLPVDDPLVELPDMFLNRELVSRGTTKSTTTTGPANPRRRYTSTCST